MLNTSIGVPSNLGCRITPFLPLQVVVRWSAQLPRTKERTKLRVGVIAEEVRTGPLCLLCMSAIIKLSQSLQVIFLVNNMGRLKKVTYLYAKLQK